MATFVDGVNRMNATNVLDLGAIAEVYSVKDLLKSCTIFLIMMVSIIRIVCEWLTEAV